MDCRGIIQDSLDYIEENIKAEITMEELAARAGFSLYHYCRLFQSAVGMPVMGYVLRRRLLHAIYAIRRGSSGIDAALTYGFETYAGFYRAFRREFGCTPSEFLRSCRAKRPCRIDLSREEHMTVTKKKAARILKNWGLEAEKIADIYYEGTGNRNESAYYVGEEWVLKVTANPGRMHSHIALSEALEMAGLCAASAVPTADGRACIREGELYFYLTRRLPGKQLAAAELYGQDPAAGGRFIGGIIGRLHLALAGMEQCVSDADLLETVKTWALPKAAEAVGLDAGFCRSWLAAFSRLYPELPRQIIHRDPNPGNIIRDGEKWGFLDFELSERNVRIYDPCYAAAAVLSESFGRDMEGWLEIYRGIFAGYDSAAALTPEEREAAPYVLLANQLVCTAWFAEQEKYAELFETNKTMTRWLAEHFGELGV